MRLDLTLSDKMRNVFVLCRKLKWLRNLKSDLPVDDFFVKSCRDCLKLYYFLQSQDHKREVTDEDYLNDFRNERKLEIKMMCIKVTPSRPNRDQDWGDSSTRDTRRKEIKAKVMDDGWMVGAVVSRLLIPGSEISFLLVSLRLFHMRAPAPCCLHPQSQRTHEPASPWHLTGRLSERERKREYRETAEKDMPSIISSARRKGRFRLSREISRGYREAQGWLNVKKGKINGKW